MSKYQRFLCPCGESHLNYEDAADCCPPEIETLYVCPFCAEEYCTEEDAVKCETACNVGDHTSLLICRVCGTHNVDSFEAVSCCSWVTMSIGERILKDFQLRTQQL